ncbi:hypothetical protein [Chondrinema litorale]|uniref:hypothetical protein n=1 Tax=Chondrinema litorale TaxID=2994555 RepID=UPI00254333AF|nr:hypothetical protein [Chondrinema litorale]UZR94756.1 hypothetical protein OQ292_02865 [Chondrinema litorale]
MEKSEIENVVRESVLECADEQGWVNLAKLGPVLKAKGIHYGKLSRFFNDYTHMLELRTDSEIQPPVVYARLSQVSETV